MNAAKTGGSGGVVSKSLRALLERRLTLQEWLAKLDDLGSRYRPEVADRVGADYEARLSEVADELEKHRDAIQSSLDERRMIDAELGQRFDSTSAELEEVELRFQIGEFDEATWASRRAEHTSTLEAIKAEQDEAASAVQEMEAVLMDLDGGNTARKFRDQKREPKPVSKPVSELEPVSESAAVPVNEPQTEPVSEPVPVADEAVELGVVSNESSGGVEEGDEFLDELEFLESLSLDDTDSFDAVSRMLEDEETAGDGSSGRPDR